MADYCKRAEALESGLVKYVKQIKRKLYLSQFTGWSSYALLQDEINTIRNQDPALFSEAVKAANSDFARNTRLKNRISTYLQMGSCIFLTLTFNDECLSHTSSSTRRDYVKKFLRKCSNHYVANVDFGSKGGREHYHAIVVAESVDFSLWKHGAINGKRIRETSEPLCLAKYISKLVNHAIKETTKRTAFIYSR